MDQSKILRINKLAAKAKTPEGLTQKEIEERAALRKEYIESVRANLLGQLNNTVIQYPDGSRKKLERKPEAELAREREQREDEENRREVDAIRKR